LREFITVTLNGLTLGGLYFLVASGFTLVFGLMRGVNLAHGSLYLLGGYIGWSIGNVTGNWVLAVRPQGLLVVEQKLSVATSLADHVLIMVKGRIALEATASALLADEDAQRRYLGVT
jgi:branched-subunit amino acid ABC-type transport system permease component